MRTYKRALTLGSTLAVTLALLLTITPHKVSAAPATIQLGPNVSATVCQFTAYGKYIRVVVSKSVWHLGAVTSVASFVTPTSGVLYATSSSTWWGDEVTTMQVPASNWYKIFFGAQNPETGANVSYNSNFIATAYTPSC